MVFIHLALVLDELGDTIHRRFVFSNLIFNDLCCLQFIRLPGKTAINRPVQNAWQFLDEFIAKSFVLFISTECPIASRRDIPCPINTSTCRNFVIISSGLARLFAISGPPCPKHKHGPVKMGRLKRLVSRQRFNGIKRHP